jgi:hypothetical protein
MSQVYLTTVKGIPLMVRCKNTLHLARFKKGGLRISEDCLKANLKNWTDEVPAENKFLIDTVNKIAGDLDCWVLKSDAKIEI